VGSTLALAYSQTHPDRVTELLLRGIFLIRKQEIDWFYQRGASVLYPDAWEPYLPTSRRPSAAICSPPNLRRLTSDDGAVRLAAAKIWSGWRAPPPSSCPTPLSTGHYEEDEFALAFARIEVHYFFNKGFFRNRRPVAAQRFAHTPHPRSDCAGPLRRRFAPWKVRGRSTVHGPKPTSSSTPTAATALRPPQQSRPGGGDGPIRHRRRPRRLNRNVRADLEHHFRRVQP